MNHDIGHHFVLPAIQEFVKQYPQVHIDFVLDDDRVDLISEEVDLAIQIGIPKDTSLIARLLYEEDFVLYAHPEFLETFGYPKTIDDLNTLYWVVLDLPNWNNAVRLHKQNSTKIVYSRVFQRCNSPFMVQKMAASGMGVALMLPATMREQVSAGQLVPVLPDWHGERTAFSLVYPSRKNLPQRIRVLIDYIVKANIFA
ncbi:substrate binding domain-containing protein [Glaciecola sp. 1036]|uniref:substrate binding domain-containing protein n=1 Tax=Alteromonadaceae TaxID=72275 RepID=UPI003CFF732F